MESNLISICIPAYDMNRAGSKCLKQLLQSIKAQQYTNYEVVVSDHSTNNAIKDVCNSFNDNNIKHLFNTKDIGSSSGNLNNAIDNASSDYIKIMFQDDFFVTKDALDIINKKFNEPAKWGASACIHYSSDSSSFYRPRYPRWQLNIKRGENTIGCPSVSFFNRCELRFDTNLLWYMDTDFYYRLFQKYGEPNIENKILIGVREDNTRVSNTLITDELINRENQIISKKYV